MRELLSEIGADELCEWEAFYEFSPFGLERGDLQAGIVASAAKNLLRGKDDRVSVPGDWMPDFGGLRKASEEKKRELTVEESIERIKQLVRSTGGIIKENGKKRE